ncbi:MAG: right-handed parallel beta-helix repeat-containing protein [Chloroflexota bacterium]
MKLADIFSIFALLTTLLLGNTAFSTNAQTNCVYTHPSTTWKINGEDHNFQPGDTICLEAGKRGPLRIENIHGTAENPITIINDGGQVITDEYDYGIKIATSSHVRLTGTGAPNHFYGIRSGGTVYVGELSTDIEVDHVETYTASFAGFMIKTDPNCNPNSWRENFTMTNISIHDNYAHNMEDGEGFYIGYNTINGVTKMCDDQELTLYAHFIEGLEVYNNITYNTGAEGIQVGSAPTDVEIYNNKIQLFGQRPFANYQNNGLQVGEGTGGSLYNNWIEEGPGNGIVMLGRADNIVYNNVIINAGSLGIFADERGEPEGNGFQFYNNTIINPGEDGLRIYAELVDMNHFKNNIIVNPGSGEYIVKLSDGVPLDESNNLFAATINEVQFVNPNAHDYHLQTGSPAVDRGTDTSSFGVTIDFDNQPRPTGESHDIGAFEFIPKLRLSGTSSDQLISLQWEIDDTLSTDITWKIESMSPLDSQPDIVDGLSEATRSYALNGLTNYEIYTITLYATENGVEIYSDTLSLMPTDEQLYLPIVLK